MLTKYWFSLIFLSKSLVISHSESNSDTNSLNITEWDIKQSNQWPSGQWDSSQWPNSQWSANQWPSGQWKPNSTSNPWSQWTQSTSKTYPTRKPVTQYPTKYPPLPSWPSTAPSTAIKPVIIIPSTQSTTPSTESTDETNDSSDWTSYTTSTTTTTTPTPSTETTTRPQTWTRPPTQPTNNQSTEQFAITVKSCGLSHIPQAFIGNKIVSGKLAKGGEFPWQVILKIHTAKGPMQCGGAILNPRWVLTAAHCVSNERNGQPTAQRIDVTAGVNNRLVMSAGNQQRTADCVVQHESWSGQYGKFKHDIALIRLPADKPFDLNYEMGGHINGICLPLKPNSEYSGKGRIAGWGLTKDRGSPSDVLLYTDVSIMNNERCKQYPYPVPIADSMMCQGVDKTAPCQGDSGGPLIMSISDNRGVQRMTEVGIVSFGPGQCANPTTPNAIYTKTSHYLKWIEKILRANSGAKCNARALKSDNSDKIEDISVNNQIKPTVSTSVKPILD